MIATKAALYFVQEEDLPPACRPLLGALCWMDAAGQKVLVCILHVLGC